MSSAAFRSRYADCVAPACQDTVKTRRRVLKLNRISPPPREAKRGMHSRKEPPLPDMDCISALRWMKRDGNNRVLANDPGVDSAAKIPYVPFSGFSTRKRRAFPVNLRISPEAKNEKPLDGTFKGLLDAPETARCADGLWLVRPDGSCATVSGIPGREALPRSRGSQPRQRR